jgi:hypothetical protein
MQEMCRFPGQGEFDPIWEAIGLGLPILRHCLVDIYDSFPAPRIGDGLVARGAPPGAAPLFLSSIVDSRV